MTSAVPSLPVILGQTATGKTSIGIALAQKLGGEIISVDSRKVYQGLPIGTATPAGEWRNNRLMVKGIPHHLMSFLPANKPYNAGDFAGDADRLINEIILRGNIPILVGGTGFYFKALAQGLPPLPPANTALRQEYEALIDQKGLPALRHELEKVDPMAAQAITDNDRHKIIRALEVFRLTGLPFSQWKNQPKKKSAYSFVVMALRIPKSELDRKIEQRSKRMFQEGMIEEAAQLLNRGVPENCPALSSFGYREAVEVIRGVLPREEFLPRLIKGTKSYAKRQATWFRTQANPAWFLVDESSDEAQIAEKMKAFCYTPPT